MTHEEFIPQQGRSVVYQIAENVWRPAQIVEVWTEEGPRTCNLVVFLDGSNDKVHGFDGLDGSLTYWATSRVLGDAVGQYLPRKP